MLFGPGSGYVGRYQRAPGGTTWMRFGPDGGFVGEVQPGAAAPSILPPPPIAPGD